MDKQEILNFPRRLKLNLIKRDKFLDIFIDDPEFGIRGCVAERGYGLDKLINDESGWVRHTVISYCKSHKKDKICQDLINLNKI